MNAAMSRLTHLAGLCAPLLTFLTLLFGASNACNSRDFNQPLLPDLGKAESKNETHGGSNTSVPQPPGFYPLPTGAVGMVPVKARVVEAAALCPQGVVCITNGTVIKLEVILPGCKDILGPVAQKLLRVEDTVIEVGVAAFAVVSAESRNAQCSDLPKAIVEVTVVGPVLGPEAITLIDLAP